MPLQLLPLEEADANAASELMWQAFKSDIMAVMYPNGYTDVARREGQARGLKEWRKHPDRIKKMKVVDTDLPDDDPFGKMVSVADWSFYPKERTEKEIEEEKAETADDGYPPDCNEEFMGKFFAALNQAKKEQLAGRPYVYLHILATHPKYHRRGIGAMQLRWGLEEADKLGLPVYLESSPIGAPLYARQGFEVKGMLPVDARDFGADKELAHTLMLRPAKRSAS